MEIVHFSDTHLGFREFHRIDPETGINQREQDVYDAFSRVIDRVLRINPDLAVHAGDIFDSVRPTNRAVNLATEEFARLSEAGIPTVLIAGNHDTPKIATTGTIIRALDRLPNVEAVTSDPEGGNSGYRKITVDNTLVHAVSDAPTEAELSKRIKKLEPDDDYNWNVLVLHAGIRTLEGQVFSGEFNEHHLDKKLIDNSGFDYIALGHYHKRVEIDLSSKTRAIYSGAPERFSFNESEYEPGFLTVNLEETGVNYSEELIETRDFIRFEPINGEKLTVKEIQEEIESQLPGNQKVEGSLISLKLTGLDDNTYSLLEERLMNDLRDKAFETNFQVVGPDKFEKNDSLLRFSDLRTEFSDFMKNRAEIPDDLDSDRLIESGQKYLGIALGEEDEG